MTEQFNGEQTYIMTIHQYTRNESQQYINYAGRHGLSYRLLGKKKKKNIE
jgi:hypothetical protein